MLISEIMAPEFVSEMAMTRKLLARIPDDKLSWKPAPDLHTIAWNASHLTDIAGWLPGIVGQSELDLAPVGGEPYVTNEPTSMKVLLAKFDDNVSKSLAALRGISDEVMAEDWSLKMGGQVLFTIHKGDCLRKWVFGHTAHHRGILSIYLRLAGVKLGSMYEE